jgi:alkyl hydroperoxide reductase subunit AhpC
MATLVLAGELSATGTHAATETVSLRSWLDEGWTLLFSHPDDFVRCELELDRWLEIVRGALATAGVRPLAVAKPSGRLDAGWVTQITGDERAVLIDEPAEERYHDWLDLGARRLIEEILALTQRFVLVVDPMLCVRRTYTYGAPERLPSPLELVRWVGALRASRDVADSPAAHTREAAHTDSTLSHPWSRSSRPSRERTRAAIRRPLGPYALA